MECTDSHSTLCFAPQHIGSVSMESANQDAVFDLVQAALAESREADGDDGAVVGSEEQYARLERRLVRLGFRADQVQEAARSVGTVDAMVVMDHLVLHTPENMLPAALRYACQRSPVDPGKEPCNTQERPTDRHMPQREEGRAEGTCAWGGRGQRGRAGSA